MHDAEVRASAAWTLLEGPMARGDPAGRVRRERPQADPQGERADQDCRGRPAGSDPRRDPRGAGKPGNANYTLREACEDWLAEDPPGNTAKTLLTNREALEHVLTAIGRTKLRELTAGDVSKALRAMAKTQSTAYVAKAHSALNRAVKHAAGRDRVARNVVSFVKPPAGQVRRKNRSMTLAQLQALLAACSEDWRLYTYIAVSATTAIRTEECRELTWDRVHLDKTPPFAEVWRSVRAGSDVKTEKSRRTLGARGAGLRFADAAETQGCQRLCVLHYLGQAPRRGQRPTTCGRPVSGPRSRCSRQESCGTPGYR